MKIYTKTGDRGSTSLFGGKRVPKDALRIEAYGTVDELNSHLGIIRALNPLPEIDAVLLALQSSLFTLGADLATPQNKKSGSIQRVQPNDIRELELMIDRIEATLEPLRAFILPGGSPVAAQLHAARTVCRRAERLTVGLVRKKEVSSHVLIFLNRLSDLLFVLARRSNALANTPEMQWKPDKNT